MRDKFWHQGWKAIFSSLVSHPKFLFAEGSEKK